MRGSFLVLALLASGCASRPASSSPAPRGPASSVAGAPKAIASGELSPALDESTQAPRFRRAGAALYLSGRLRVAVHESGLVERGRELFPAGVVEVVDLPTRLGGGFVFYQSGPRGTMLWRARSWTGPLTPLATLGRTVTDVVPGFDRLYLRGRYNSLLALDAEDGRLTSNGPLPLAASFGALGFVDGWRAVVEADLLGPLATYDGGNTWHEIPEVDELRSVFVDDDEVFLVTEDGRVRLDAEGRTMRVQNDERGDLIADTEEVVLPQPLALGDTPLRVALARGVPDSAHTVLAIARGKLARIALPEGRIVALVEGALPDDLASCQGIRLGDSLGFVCTGERGPTTVLRLEPPLGLAEVRRFDEPRFVASSGNGQLVVRGACGSDHSLPRDVVEFRSKTTSAPGPTTVTESATRRYCVLDAGRSEREIAIKGEIGVERVVGLRDGRTAVVVPPRPGADGSVHVLPMTSVKPVALAIPEEPALAARVAREGLWLEGMWEAEGGGLGGWVEAGGRVLGVTVGLDGRVSLGALVDAPARGLFSEERALVLVGDTAHESLDGGRSWSRFTLPPLPSAANVTVAGCTAVGCVLPGWTRMGWGSSDSQQRFVDAPEPPSRVAPLEVPPSLPLRCTVRPSRAAPRRPAVPKAAAPAWKPPASAARPGVTGPPAPTAARPAASARAPSARGAPATGVAAGRPPLPSSLPGVAPKAAPPSKATDDPAARGWVDFVETAPPVLGPGEIGVGKPTFSSTSSRAHVYAWGPKATSWSKAGWWQIRFEDRFAATDAVRSTARGRSPWPDLDGALELFGARPTAGFSQWHAVRDPGGRAALVTVCRANASPCELFSAVEGEAPIILPAPRSMRRPMERSAVRVGRRWYFLVEDVARHSQELWRADVDEVAPIAVMRRVGGGRQQSFAPVTLARRFDESALALVTTLPPDELQPSRPAQVAVFPLDVATGALGVPERIGLDSLGVRPRRCDAEDDGWLVELPAFTATALNVVDAKAHIDGVELLLRLDADGSCVDGLVGRATRGLTLDKPTVRAGQKAAPPGSMPLVVLEPGKSTRHALDCTAP
jgi:hypothetical protein